MARNCYPTDLAEGQWAQLAPLLPPQGIGPPLRPAEWRPLAPAAP